MKLSLRGEYALRAMLVLAMEYRDDSSVVRIAEISRRQNIPKRFLEQILNDLKSGRFVESKRGVAGGYRMRRNPQQVTLAEIVRYIEGPLAPVSCVSESYYEKCSCPDETRCPIRDVMREVRDRIAQQMESTTLQDLAERGRKLQTEPLSSADFVI